MLALVVVLVVIIAVLLGNRLHFEFSCHFPIIPYLEDLWYN